MRKSKNRYVKKRKYGLGNFILDIILVCFTGGLWFIWIFAREMRNL